MAHFRTRFSIQRVLFFKTGKVGGVLKRNRFEKAGGGGSVVAPDFEVLTGSSVVSDTDIVFESHKIRKSYFLYVLLQSHGIIWYKRQ